MMVENEKDALELSTGNKIEHDSKTKQVSTKEQTYHQQQQQQQQQQQHTDHEDDDFDDVESVVIKVIIPGLDNHDDSKNNGWKHSSSKRTNNRRNDQSSWKEDARKLDRLYSWWILILIVLLIAAVSVTTATLVYKSTNGTSEVLDNNSSANGYIDPMDPNQSGRDSNGSHYNNSNNTNYYNDTTNSNKMEWPELINADAAIAKAVILNDNPNLNVIIVVKNETVVSTDYRTDRVRIYVDTENVVVQVPQIG